MNVVMGCRPWNKAVFEECKPATDWMFVDSLGQIPATAKRIFFVNWLERVPEHIWREIECIAFHASPLPFGRGASPIQHQILAGLESTHLSAFRMCEKMDAGGVYLQEPLSLLGSAEEIYLRAARLAMQMAGRIARYSLVPRPQDELRVTTLRRRKPSESLLPPELGLARTYDFIRMLDCEGFPPAFIVYGKLRIEFTRAALRHDRIEATVTIREIV